MSLLFCDSFDHYGGPLGAQILLKYSGESGSNQYVDLTGTLSRTGRGCLSVTTGGFGNAIKGISEQTALVVGDAFYIANLPAGGYYNILNFKDVINDILQVRLVYYGDGSIGVLNGNDPFPVTLGRSASNLLHATEYNYVECKFNIAPLADVVVRVNGQTVLVLAGVQTQFPGSNPYCDVVQLAGAGSLGGDRHDDFYLLTQAGTTNNDFLGAIRIFAILPTADSAPLQWTPSTVGTHYTLVDAVPATSPPPPDVESNSVGQVDQYVYNPSGVIMAPSRILGVQHCMVAQLDASGSHSVASQVEGVASGGLALSTSGNMILFQYDTNPVTGLAWELTDFPGTTFGPALTA